MLDLVGLVLGHLLFTGWRKSAKKTGVTNLTKMIPIYKVFCKFIP